MGWDGMDGMDGRDGMDGMGLDGMGLDGWSGMDGMVWIGVDGIGWMVPPVALPCHQNDETRDSGKLPPPGLEPGSLG